MDRVLAELLEQFWKSRDTLQANAALTVSECLHNPHSVCPLTEECNLDLDCLFNQLAIAKNLIQKRKIETVEMSLTVLTTNQEAFHEAICLYRIAVPIPVTSASAERSFTVLKTYLRSTETK